MSTPRGWPADWAERVAGRDCPLCAVVGTGDDEHAVAVAELPFSEVRLERRSRLPGYCIVVWRFRHVAEPDELALDEAAGYWHDVLRAGRAIRTVFQPVKLNLMTLGNWVPHLHTHVVPRYPDDPAAGGPLAWPQLVADEQLAPDEVLAEQAAALRRALAGRGPHPT